MEAGEDGNTDEEYDGAKELEGLFDGFDDEDDEEEDKGVEGKLGGPVSISPTARRRMESEGADSPSTDMMEMG